METTDNEVQTHRIKNFIERHKVAIAVTTTTVACVVVNRIALKQHDEFLREHDLYDEFYSDPEEL